MRWYDIDRRADWEALRAEAADVFHRRVTRAEAQTVRNAHDRCVFIHPPGVEADELAVGRGQHALEADNEQIAKQVGVNVLGPTAHVFLLEAGHPFADGGLDFSLAFHGEFEGAPIATRRAESATPGCIN